MLVPQAIAPRYGAAIGGPYDGSLRPPPSIFLRVLPVRPALVLSVRQRIQRCLSKDMIRYEDTAAAYE